MMSAQITNPISRTFIKVNITYPDLPDNTVPTTESTPSTMNFQALKGQLAQLSGACSYRRTSWPRNVCDFSHSTGLYEPSEWCSRRAANHSSLMRGERNRTTGGADRSACHAAIRSRLREKLRKCQATMD